MNDKFITFFNESFTACHLIRSVFLISLGTAATCAHSGIYRYVDSDTGSTIYSNVKPKLQTAKPSQPIQSTPQPDHTHQSHQSHQSHVAEQSHQDERKKRRKQAREEMQAQLAEKAREAAEAREAQQARVAQQAKEEKQVRLAKKTREAAEAREALQASLARLAEDAQQAKPSEQVRSAPQSSPPPHHHHAAVIPEDKPRRVSMSVRPVSTAPATRANFPRVTPATQRQRDSERRRILTEELEAEQAAMNDAIATQAATEVIHRHRANVAALERELGNTR